MSNSTPPIRVYIENARDDSIGGFTIPLPTTREALKPWLEAIEAPGFNEEDISIGQVRSPIPQLEQALAIISTSDLSFDELNYLAVKIAGMNTRQQEVFAAVVEAEITNGWKPSTVQNIINISENTDNFDWLPVTNAQQYAEMLMKEERTSYDPAKIKLHNTDDPDLQALAKYIETLEERVDILEDDEFRGIDKAEEEDGTFTSAGYIVQSSKFVEPYHGLQDIPPEHRIFTAPQPLMITHSQRLPTFLTLLHAMAGNHMQDAENSVTRVARLRSAEYLLLMDRKGAHITETALAYHFGNDAWTRWTQADPGSGTMGFAIHITEVHGSLEGRVAQVDVRARQLDILENQIVPTKIVATSQSGERHTFTLEEWEALSEEDKHNFDDVNRDFTDEALTMVHRHRNKLCAQDEQSCRAVSEKDFLAHINRNYMEAATYYSTEHLRISPMAAKDILARQDIDVYSIGPSGVEKLSPMEVVKGGAWSDHWAFAVRPQDSPKLDKWAEHVTADMLDRTRRRQESVQTQGPER